MIRVLMIRLFPEILSGTGKIHLWHGGRVDRGWRPGLLSTTRERVENCVLHGDESTEAFLSKVGAQPYARAHHMNLEANYGYESLAGL